MLWCSATPDFDTQGSAEEYCSRLGDLIRNSALLGKFWERGWRLLV